MNIIRNNRALRTSTSPYRQFHELLLAAKGSPNATLPIVVVIDALDESGNHEERAEILSILRKTHEQRQKDFRFLITSRFEQDIADALFRNPHIDMERMHDIDRQSTDADIYRMICELLPSVPSLDARYPNHRWRHMLVQKAEGIFQWAATACRVIQGSGKRRNHHTQFEALMSAGSQLYSLYLAVLDDIFDSHDVNDMRVFRAIIGAVLVAREPFTVDTLKRMYAEEDCNFVITPLGSLLSGTADGEPITPLHTSFRDFVIDSIHAGAFSVDLTVSNQQMSLLTLRCMNRNLTFNMGNCRSSYFASKMSSHLPAHVIYSCRFWADHINPENLDIDILQDLMTFFHSNFLYWLEVLSLTGSMNIAGPSLTIVTEVGVINPMSITNTNGYLR